MLDSVTSYNASMSTSSDQVNASRNKLAGDLDNFLTLLTAQLQAQDPLSPMESSEFTTQLVQFAQVEQQINMNDRLDSLVTMQQQSRGAAAVGYIDSTVEAVTDQLPLQDGAARFSYSIGENTKSTTIVIRNADDEVIHSITGKTTAGTHEVRWDGTDRNGNQLEDGTYTISVNAIPIGGDEEDVGEVETSTTVLGRVTGVTAVDNEPYLLMDDVAVPLTHILGVVKSRTRADSLATDYLGTTVEIAGSKMPLQDGQGHINYTLLEKTQTTILKIRNAEGVLVREITGENTAGPHELVWDGTDASGNQLADGVYTINVETTAPQNDGDGYVGATTTFLGKVTGVTSKNDKPYIAMGDLELPVSAIVRVTDNG